MLIDIRLQEIVFGMNFKILNFKIQTKKWCSRLRHFLLKLRYSAYIHIINFFELFYIEFSILTVHFLKIAIINNYNY